VTPTTLSRLAVGSTWRTCRPCTAACSTGWTPSLTAACDTGDPDPLRAILQGAVHRIDPTIGTGVGRKRREVHAPADTLRGEVAARAHSPGPGHHYRTPEGPMRPSTRDLTNGAPAGQRRLVSAAVPVLLRRGRGDPEPVAGGVLDQDRHELAGGVDRRSGDACPAPRAARQPGSSMLNCADSRCTTWAIAASSAREAGITYQHDRPTGPVNPASGDTAKPQNTRDHHTPIPW